MGTPETGAGATSLFLGPSTPKVEQCAYLQRHFPQETLGRARGLKLTEDAGHRVCSVMVAFCGGLPFFETGAGLGCRKGVAFLDARRLHREQGLKRPSNPSGYCCSSPMSPALFISPSSRQDVWSLHSSLGSQSIFCRL